MLKVVKLLEQVVAVQEKVLKEDYPSRLASQHALIIVYKADGQVLEAVKLLEQVVTVYGKRCSKKIIPLDWRRSMSSQAHIR